LLDEKNPELLFSACLAKFIYEYSRHGNAGAEKFVNKKLRFGGTIKNGDALPELCLSISKTEGGFPELFGATCKVDDAFPEFCLPSAKSRQPFQRAV
jgi:hypothetical protein